MPQLEEKRRLPAPTPPKWWQRAVAGGIGALGGYLSASGMRGAMEAAQDVGQEILYPGYGRRLKEYEAERAEAEREEERQRKQKELELRQKQVDIQKQQADTAKWYREEMLKRADKDKDPRNFEEYITSVAMGKLTSPYMTQEEAVSMMKSIKEKKEADPNLRFFSTVDASGNMHIVGIDPRTGERKHEDVLKGVGKPETDYLSADRERRRRAMELFGKIIEKHPGDPVAQREAIAKMPNVPPEVKAEAYRIISSGSESALERLARLLGVVE